MSHTIIDIRKIDNLNCGLGQFAYHLSNQLKNKDFLFYINKKEKDLFAIDNLKLSSPLHKSGFFFPKCRVWHSIHQDVDRIPKNKKIKIVLTIHDLNFLTECHDTKKRKLYISNLQKKINRADYLTFVSEFALGEVQKYFDLKATKYKVIHNGVCISDKEVQKRPSSIDFNTNIKNFYFSIGTVVEKKNFHILINLAQKFPEEFFVLAGSIFNDYGYNIVKLKEKFNLNNLYLLGNIDEDEKKWLLANCKALIHPSKLEGFGIPLIEAFSYGKPVFCSNACSMPEVGGKFARYFDPYDVDDIINVLKINQKIFPLTRENTRELVNYSMKFNWKDASNEYTKIYSSLY